MKRVRALLVGVLLVLPGTFLLAGGMQMQYADLFTMKGKVIAKGNNTNPIGTDGLKTYRIEELTLGQGTTINVNGSIVQANTAWRIVLVGNAFQVRDLPAIISVDGRDLPPGQESTNLQEIATITFDRALIRDNAVLALAYGTNRTELPERVKLDR